MRIARRFLVLPMLLILISMLIFAGKDAYAAESIRETDTDTASSGCEIVMLDGNFIYLSKEDILKKINEIRLEACREGVRDPRNGSNRLTEADYVPIKWSSELEWIAQTRAAEATVHMDHQRPNGKSCFTVNHNGISSFGEVLAWNNSANIIGGINQWYGEKSDWVNKTSGAVTGHYTSMINPNNTYIGIGAFKPESGYGAVAGEFKSSGTLDESQTGAQGAYKQKIEVKTSNLEVSVDGSLTVNKGETKNINLSATTSYDNDLGPYWSPTVSSVSLSGAHYNSTDTNIATVDANGAVTGVKAGTTVIKISAGSRSYDIAVTVNDHTHKWVKQNTVNATCTTDGSETYKCSDCGETKTETIKSPGHIWNASPTVDKEPTCTEKGKQSVHCSKCDEKKDETEIAALGHDWETTTTIDKKPTCQEEGTASIHCSRCDISKEGSSVAVPIGDHSFSKWKTTTPATELSDGEQTRECIVCGETESRIVSQVSPSLKTVKITKAKAAKKAATVSWKKLSKANLKKTKKIEIQYSLDKSFATGVKTKYASAKKPSLKIKGLKSGKKYYVRLRAYTKSGSTVHISNWSSIKTVKVK